MRALFLSKIHRRTSLFAAIGILGAGLTASGSAAAADHSAVETDAVISDAVVSDVVVSDGVVSDGVVSGVVVSGGVMTDVSAARRKRHVRRYRPDPPVPLIGGIMAPPRNYPMPQSSPGFGYGSHDNSSSYGG